MLVVTATLHVEANAQETAVQEAGRRKAALSFLPKDAARRLFSAATSAAPGDMQLVGEYWKGCYTGGVPLAGIGEHWQVMRLSRNRNWGTPFLIHFLERFAKTATQVTGWRGIVVGDMSQPRGGPMLTGHASHQLGIESDIWLRPMPDRPWTATEIEEVLSTDLLRADRRDVDPKVYTPQHFALLRAAASQPEVARVFVNAAIKKALCRDAGDDRSWLRKIRPAAGHSYHFHIRLACPPGQSDCIDQAPPDNGDGCGKDLDYWFTSAVLNSKSSGGPGKALPVASMPAGCRKLVSTTVAGSAAKDAPASSTAGNSTPAAASAPQPKSK